MEGLKSVVRWQKTRGISIGYDRRQEMRSVKGAVCNAATRVVNPVRWGKVKLD